MLTGQSPYEYGYSAALGSTRGKERGALLRNIILTDPLPKLNRPDIPPQVERILRKALNKTPEDRYYSAYDFARDMQRAQQELYGHATPTTVEGEPPFPQNLYAQSQANIQVSPTVPKQRSTWAKPLAIVVSAVAAITAVALVFAYVILPNMDSLPTIAACRSRIRERTIRTTIRLIRPSPQVACPVSRIWPAHIPPMAAACSSHG